MYFINEFIFIGYRVHTSPAEEPSASGSTEEPAASCAASKDSDVTPAGGADYSGGGPGACGQQLVHPQM